MSRLSQTLLRQGLVARASFSMVYAHHRAAGATTGDPNSGARQFRACAACHSLVPGRNRTGSSLAGVVGRKAGTADGVRRYSSALTDSGVVRDERSLDAWTANPEAFLPGTRKGFRGLPDAQARADLIAYLVQIGPGGAARQPDGMGMGCDDELPDLKRVEPRNRVTAIPRCANGYDVTTADGAIVTFWETDGSDRGQAPGKPVIVGAGMMGDRTSVVFAAPEEISPYIAPGC